jgi:SAM-dependent methyltransferase
MNEQMLDALTSRAFGPVPPGLREDLVEAAVKRGREKWATPPPIGRQVCASLDGVPPLRVLELGSGDGWLAIRLAQLGHRVHGIDPTRENRYVAQRAAELVGVDDHATFEHNALDDLSAWPEDSFDLVLADRSLLYTDLEAVLDAAHRVLGPQGRLTLIFQGAGHFYRQLAAALSSGQTADAASRLDALLRTRVGEAGVGNPRLSLPRIADPERVSAQARAYGYNPELTTRDAFLGMPALFVLDAARRERPEPLPGAAAWDLLDAGCHRLVLSAGTADGAALAAARIGMNAPPGDWSGEVAGTAPDGVPLAALARYNHEQPAEALPLLEPARDGHRRRLLMGLALRWIGRAEEADAVAADALRLLGPHEPLLLLRLALAVHRESVQDAWALWAELLRSCHTTAATRQEVGVELSRLRNLRPQLDVAKMRARARQILPRGVELRHFPYPYRAMLAISSDIDQTSIARFRETHRFLNTLGETSMGPGVGLDVGDTFWLYHPESTSRKAGDDVMSYFDGLDWTRVSADAPEILHYIRCGWIDSIHTYGNFSGIGEDERRCTRRHAEAALEVLRTAGASIRVWINHGDRNNVQNMGGHDYMEGDDPRSPAYHWDLLREHGVEFVWNAEDSFVFGEQSKVRSAERRDGTESWEFTRFYNARYDAALRWGLRPAVARQLQRTRDYAVLWHPMHLHIQLSEENLQALVDAEQFAIVAQHLGAARPLLRFGAPAVDALRRVAERQRVGEILVARTERLLVYNRARDYLRYQTAMKGPRLQIDITGIDDPVRGRVTPRLDELAGITFRVPDPAAVDLLLGGEPIAKARVARNPTDGTSPSVGIRWHAPNHADHTQDVEEDILEQPRGG